MSELKIKVFVGVKYEMKDEAKKQGAKWDPERKSWYFIFNNSNGSFFNNNSMNTKQFRPHGVALVGKYTYENMDMPSHKYIDYCFGIAHNRHIDYKKNALNNLVVAKNDPNIEAQFMDDGECPVCLEVQPLRKGYKKCDHEFCNECISKWKQTKSTCPLCRSI
jgi:hypothetical protein